MKYLSGVTNDRVEPALAAAGVGLMLQPGNSYHRRVDRFPFYAADNGCFADKWDEATHLGWLEALPRPGCLFAVSPDVYPDAAESLSRGLSYAPLIRDMGFPVAIVAQDGAEELAWPWDDLDVLFVGGKKGPKEWKTSDEAAALVREARRHGKWVHMGRVNSLLRMERAREMGCNSADGTFLKFRLRARAADATGEREERGAAEVGGWLDWLEAHPVLPSGLEAPAPPWQRAGR